MPFGFWVLGNKNLGGSHGQGERVSNAFRLLGSGEHTFVPEFKYKDEAVSNAFRLLGSGELSMKIQKQTFTGGMSQMPFGFWVLGNSLVTNQCGNTWSGLKCLSAFGFWGTPSL